MKILLIAIVTLVTFLVGPVSAISFWNPQAGPKSLIEPGHRAAGQFAKGLVSLYQMIEAIEHGQAAQAQRNRDAALEYIGEAAKLYGAMLKIAPKYNHKISVEKLTPVEKQDYALLLLLLKERGKGAPRDIVELTAASTFLIEAMAERVSKANVKLLAESQTNNHAFIREMISYQRAGLAASTIWRYNGFDR